ncbi:MAG: hypothetical protein LKJ88_00420 [Bacilli bacterium]|jgi:hypothetical protein|nr:hypothetical protein [Bacilli bacterium]
MEETNHQKTIEEDGIDYKSSKRLRRNSVLTVTSIETVLEITIFIICFFLEGFKDKILLIGLVLLFAFLLQSFYLFTVWKEAKRVLLMTDLEAGKEYERLLMEKQKRLDERSRRDQ